MNEVLQYLKEAPPFRERVNKNKGIANMSSKKYGVEFPADKRNDIIAEILSYDRAWRKALEEHPELQGKDYNEKERLEQQKQIELGYESGYYHFVKRGTPKHR